MSIDVALVPPEVWGGIECTLNRVGDRYFDQLVRSGHRGRLEDDIDAFATLGITALRYPVLWEEAERAGEDRWAIPDRALSALERSGIRPLVGLMHHGSGPPHTSLMDSGFPAAFAAHAAAVATRYPWLDEYTPVNEPLTTARFSGLYGFWYPHERSDQAFVQALLGQIEATVAAMTAIRRMNPDTRLLQTEDLGFAQGTPATREQVAFENERRWLTFDLLCGRVDAGHPLYDYLTGPGAADRDRLARLVAHPCPPDTIGINHYPRSNRWLDERLELYPSALHGGNGELRYADVGASDTAHAPPVDVQTLIEQAWARYGIPIALTEVHVPGDADAQVAWWNDALAAAEAARATGAAVRAVTTWSLLGAYDWDTLCTRGGPEVTYESGAFRIVEGRRERTPVGEAVRASALATVA